MNSALVLDVLDPSGPQIRTPATFPSMPDATWIQARLRSPLFGAMLQMAELAGPGAHADAVAARLFNPPPDTPDTYFNAARLGLSPAAERQLHDWPRRRHSIFSALGDRGPRDGLCRPLLLTADDEAGRGPFHPIDTVKPVVDAVGLACPAAGETFCTLVLLRCGGSAPFEPQRLETLDRLRPEFSHLLAQAYRLDSRAARGTTADGSAKHDADLHHASLLLARLSRTERTVLRYLREHMTEKQVAQQIHRSPHTVHVHVKNIYRKLGVCSRGQLLALFEPSANRR